VEDAKSMSDYFNVAVENSTENYYIEVRKIPDIVIDSPIEDVINEVIKVLYSRDLLGKMYNGDTDTYMSRELVSSRCVSTLTLDSLKLCAIVNGEVVVEYEDIRDLVRDEDVQEDIRFYITL